MAGAGFDIMSYLKYFLTLKGIFRIINFCYFVFFFLLSAIFSGVLGAYSSSVSISLHQTAISFSSFLCFCISVGEVAMSIVDMLNLSFLKPYTFFILLGDTIAHGVAALLLFITAISLAAYAASFGSCSNCGNIAGIEGTAAFFGFVGTIILCVTIGVFIYLLITRSGTKSTADPV